MSNPAMEMSPASPLISYMLLYPGNFTDEVSGIVYGPVTAYPVDRAAFAALLAEPTTLPGWRTESIDFDAGTESFHDESASGSTSIGYGWGGVAERTLTLGYKGHPGVSSPSGLPGGKLTAEFFDCWALELTATADLSGADPSDDWEAVWGGSDGPQTLYFYGTAMDAVTSVKAWRLPFGTPVPGETPHPPHEFWTDFVGTQEII